MGCGWYREAHYPPEAADRPAQRRRPGSRDDRGVARRRRRHGRAAGDHRRDRDRQAVGQRPRGAGASRRGARRASRPAWRSPPTACARRSAWRSCASSKRRASIPRVSSSGMPIHTRCSITTWPSWSAAPTCSSTSSGHRFQTEEAAEPRLVELIVELLERGWGAAAAAQPGRLPQQPAQGARRLRLHLPAAAFPADPAHRGGRRGRAPPDHGREPAPHPDAALMSVVPGAMRV